MNYEHYAAYAAQLAREAGQLIREKRSRGFSFEEKHSNHDFVTSIDKESEIYIKEKLHKAFPDIEFVGEEQERDEKSLADYLEHMQRNELCWIVDPLDGTINFLKGLPGYAVSIGLRHHDQIVAGAIYIPDTEELFSASLGAGAACNGKKIHVSSTGSLDNAFLTTSLPVDAQMRRRALLQFDAAAKNCMNIRMIGAAARAIAYTACGIFDGYWDIGPHPWDVAAGILILQEAGGVVTNDRGQPYTAYDDCIVASNGAIQAELLDRLGG